jgi:hypothetical protein
MKKLKLLFMLLFIFHFSAIAQDEIQNKIRQQILSKTDSVALRNLGAEFENSYRLNKEEAIKLLLSKGYLIKKTYPDGRGIELQGFKDGRPKYYVTYNIIAAQTTSTDDVWGYSGFNLDGTLIDVGLWDEGSVYVDHNSFREGTCGQRHAYFIDSTGSTVSNHSTHVAGTIIADNDDYSAKGMANESVLYSRDWNWDVLEMTNAAAGIDPNLSSPLIISNHSYGNNPGWQWADLRNVGTDAWYWTANNSDLEDPSFGDYTDESFNYDQIAFNAPYYSIVWAAGNDRGEGPEAFGQHWVWDGDSWVSSTTYHPKDGGDDGFDCVPPEGVTKNIITVGAIDDITYGYQIPSDVQQINTSFSDWGPTKDGRIKPDIVANGDALYSTLPNNTFGYLSGTSMAAPNVTGAISLLLQHYKNTHNNTLPLSSTLKAIVIHTADERGGNVGPDYKYGWGLLNTYKAAQLISQDEGDQKVIQELSIGIFDYQTVTINDLYSDGTQPIKITLAWTDKPPLSPSFGPILMRDLDVRLYKDGVQYKPWKLDPANPNSAATTGDDSKNNVEQIFLQTPAEGYYTVVISHKGLLDANSATFSIVLSGFVSPLTDIHIKQLGFNNQTFGQAAYWEGSQWNYVNPTNTVSITLGKNHFLSSQDFKPSSYEKFIKWDDNIGNIRYRNWDTLSIKSITTEVRGRFNPTTDDVSVFNSLEASGSLTASNISFKDPWLVNINELPFGMRSDGLKAQFIPYASPLSLSRASNFKGVFLNQGGTGFTPPYYSVKTDLTQDIVLHTTGVPSGRNHKFYFQNWSGTNVTFQDPNNTETPVVFTLDGATAQANLKGTQLTTTNFNTSKNSQRGFIRDTFLGYLHNVYESMGDIWYERSTDNGATWYLMNNGKPINPNYKYSDAKSPSICFNSEFNLIYIVYQVDENSFPYYGIVLTQFSANQTKTRQIGRQRFGKPTILTAITMHRLLPRWVVQV